MNPLKNDSNKSVALHAIILFLLMEIGAWAIIVILIGLIFLLLG